MQLVRTFYDLGRQVLSVLRNSFESKPQEYEVKGKSDEYTKYKEDLKWQNITLPI